MSISPNVVIMTTAELDDIKQKAFQRGVERGKFEARNPNNRIAENCAHWKDGHCEKCGVQWQYFEVAGSHQCAHFRERQS